MILNFSDFMDRLAQGQLRDVASTDKSQSGVIKPEYYEHLLKLTNQGLVDLSTKKKLFEGMATLDFVEDQNVYPLDVTSGADYENLVKVLEIRTSNERMHTPKNSVHIMQPNQETLRFSDYFMECHGPSVDVRFQTHHPELTDVDDDMNLPNHLYEVLALYVAGLYLAHKGGAEGKARGDSYYGLYLQKCNDDVIYNSSSTSELTDEDTRFFDRGFV